MSQGTKSVKEIYTAAIASIPQGKQSFGYQLVVIPCLGAYMKSNSINGAKTLTIPGGMLTLPVKSNSAFLKSRNVWIVKEGKMYRRGQEETPLQLRMNFTSSMLAQLLADADEEEIGSKQSQLTQQVQKMIAEKRGQIHLVCYDHIQAAIKTPTYKADEMGEHEELVVTTNAVFSIRFVEEDSEDYIHRVDMPAQVNSRYLGSEVTDQDKPEVVDAFAPRVMSRKQVVTQMKQLIENEKDFLKSASLEEIQEKVGSTKKEVEQMWKEFLESDQEESEETMDQTEAIQAGNSVKDLLAESADL